ncbi:MAG: LysR family transcriptional regulator [Vulcanimicrobiota bacterium]
MTLFVAVAEQGSLARAGDQLGMSPPAVTRALAQLEARLGVRLLHRTTRRLRLSEAGQRYLDDCRRILNEVRESEDWLRGEQTSAQGRLQLTAPVLFGQSYVMPVVREYLDLQPRVQAQVLLLDRVVNLLEEGLDLAVRIGPLPDSSLRALRVGEVRRLFCAAPDYLERQGTPRQLSDLRQHRLISSQASLAKAPVRLQVNTNQAALEAALAGWGVVRLLSYQVAPHLHAGRLQVILEEHTPAAWPIHVLHQEGRRISLKVQLLVDLLATRLRAHPDLRAS